MASRKTEATELSLAFGMLGIDEPLNCDYQQIEHLFEETLPEEKFYDFQESYRGEFRTICERMLRVGLEIREKHPFVKNYPTLRWIGEQRVYITTSLSKDIQIGPIAVSAKAKSDVVANLSPPNLLIALPTGQTTSTKSDNWFLTVAKDDIQELYTQYRPIYFQEQPEDVEDFFKQTTQETRKSLVRRVVSISEVQTVILDSTYRKLCHKTAQRSADVFNQHLREALSSNQSRGVQMGIIKTFFRLNSSPYILAGVDRREDIALSFPDANTWNQNWEFVSIEASPDLNAGQSVVKFLLKIRNKKNKAIHEFKYHAEIRWSHGKFCGNPEGKLYKDFAWKDLPFVEDLLSVF